MLGFALNEGAIILTGPEQEKINAVLAYLEEEFPNCLVDNRKAVDERTATHTWNFTVVCGAIFYTAVFYETIWVNHNASTIYDYLSRISLANLLRKNPGKPIAFMK
jgi:hypothetical protein